ncbi:hypothetical protein IJU85_01270 [Candidatus Saccharibacteria bacterium]|nr:hypothetical protein [Candidatus Saccharibacteria bacterium]
MKKRSVFLGISALLSGFLLVPSASAYIAGPRYLTYQTPVDIKFTFNSTLSISLSSADLLIANLAPGASASSNTITVSVNTNNITGYTLSAKVGDGTTYTNDKLVNSSSNTYFDNLTSSSTLSNFGNNKWGYALGTISSSSTYSGLVYNTDTIINATTNASGTAATGYTGTSNTSFTIAAKASDTQASGDYKNIIIFTVVSNIVPMTINDLEYMQDFATLSASDKTSVLNSMTTNTQYQLADSRDGKEYYIAKLADGNVWMTQNLDHDIDSTYNYNSTNTDVPAIWDDILTSTYATGDTTWHSAFTAPESYDPGDLCWNGTIASNYSGTLSTYAEACGNDKHYHIGNYYNWSAAVVLSDSSGIIDHNDDADQSICPAGWMLPKSGTALTGSGTFVYLHNQLDGNVHSSPTHYVYGGYWLGSSLYVGGEGFYWSSVVCDSDCAYLLTFNKDGTIDPQTCSYRQIRSDGYSVRCVAR